MIHGVGHEDDLHVSEPDKQDKRFDAVRIKYINLDSVKSMLSTKLEFSRSLIKTL